MNYGKLQYNRASKTRGYGMFDPRTPKAVEARELFGADVIPLQQRKVARKFGVNYIEVDVSALGEDQVERYCRAIARRNGCRMIDVYLTVADQGILLDGTDVEIFPDPDEAREFWRFACGVDGEESPIA